MNDPAPVILIEDDPDDMMSISAAYQETGCPHPLQCFDRPDAALAYLHTTTDVPFMIIADVNMPGMDGLAMRSLMRGTKLHTMAAVPFYFLAASAETRQLHRGFELLIQGFFIKPVSFSDLVEIIAFMVKYATVASE